MKKIKVLSGLAVLGTCLAAVVSCGESEAKLTNEDIVKAALSANILYRNDSVSMRDTTWEQVNELDKTSADYVIALTQYTYLDDVGNSYVVPISWEYDETYFSSIKEDDEAKSITLKPKFPKTYLDVTEISLTATATLEDVSLSATYVLSAKNDKDPTTAVQPEMVRASVSDVIAAENSKETAYYVTGKVKYVCDSKQNEIESINAYGDLILEDLDDSSQSIFVYGLSANFRALSYDGDNQVFKFSNKKDAATDSVLSKVKKGDTITIAAIRSDYGDTKELVGVLSSVNFERANAQEATIEEILESEGASSKSLAGRYLFSSTATVKTLKNDQYGNMTLVDDNDNEVTVYGATASENKISFNFKDSWRYSISNPKDWLTNETSAAIKEGDKISFTCCRCDYKGAIQLALEGVKKVA